MKPANSLLILPLFLASCAGGWHDEDKARIRTDCMQQADPQIGEAKAKAYCDCFVEKMVHTYPVFNDFMDKMNIDTVNKLKAECRSENGL